MLKAEQGILNILVTKMESFNIANVSGGGKTTAVAGLAHVLPNTKGLYVDQYDCVGPEDMMDWLDKGADINEWNLQPLLADLERLLVAMFFAKQFPDKLKSLTISGVTKQKPENWLEMHRTDVAAQAGLLNNEEAVDYFNHLHGAGWDRFITMGRNEEWYPFHETSDLTGIAAPVLVIAGEGNSNESISAIDYEREQENVHGAIIPLGSHLIHAEQPQLYSKILKLFLNNVQAKQT